MINKLIIISTLILTTSLAVNWVLEEPETVRDETSRNDPDVYMLNATIADYGETGKLEHILSAKKFTHFPLTDLTTMKEPQIDLKAEYHWEISAREGRLLSASTYREEIIELWGNVLANQAAKDDTFIQIQTKSLTVYPDRDYLETDERVFIDNETGRTTAAGMKAFLNTGYFQFFSDKTEPVITVFLPK